MKKNDVWSHKQLKNVVSHTEIERAKLLDILESGNFIDTFKKLIPSSENLSLGGVIVHPILD